jgi:hypothetical protein
MLRSSGSALTSPLLAPRQSFGHSTVPATLISALAVLKGNTTDLSAFRGTSPCAAFQESLELESDIESRRFSAGEPIRDELGLPAEAQSAKQIPAFDR